MLNVILNSEQRKRYEMLCRSLHPQQSYNKREQSNQYEDKSQNIEFDSDKGLDGKVK